MTTTELTNPLEKRSNFWHLYGDVFWWGVLAGSSISFLSIFITRQGASSLQVSLLTAGPAIVSLLFSLPAGRWLAGQPFLRTTFLSSIWYRVGYLLLVPIPFLVNAEYQIRTILWVSILMSIPGTVLAISFNAAFAEVVPPADRAMVVGRRNALVSLSMVTTSLLCGQILVRISFPMNYMVVFLLGALGAVLSSYHLSRLRLSSRTPQVFANRPLMDFSRPGIQRFLDAARSPAGLRYITRDQARKLVDLKPLQGPFGTFLLAYLAFYIFQYTAIPLFPLFQVRVLELSDANISLGTALFYLMMLLTSFWLPQITGRLGHKGVLLVGAFFYSVYPVLNAFAQDIRLYLVASILGGVTWAFANGGLINRLMERVPEDQLPSHMALHNLVLNLGIILGSLGSPILADALGLREALLAAAGLRLLGAIFLTIWA